MDKKELGSRIKLARSIFHQKTGVKMTQQLLAERIGISRSYMGDIESGRTYPTFVVLNSISEACGIPLSFFGQNEDEIKAALGGNINSIDKNIQACKALDKALLKSPKPLQSKSSLAAHDIISDSTVSNFVIVPILGVIRAGEPISAEQNIIGYEYIPLDMSRSGVHFGLRVTGDSMNNSRIFEGDIVLVRQQEEVENGEIAAVLVDGEDATIKRVFRNDHIITLMPDSSNKEHQPRFIDLTKDEVRILGKVVKVIINM